MSYVEGPAAGDFATSSVSDVLIPPSRAANLTAFFRRLALKSSSCYKHSCAGVCVEVSFPLGQIPKSMAAGLYSKMVFSFVSKWQNVLQNGGTDWYSYSDG